MLLFSCRKETSIWESLTQEEKDEILAAASAKCRADKQQTYNNFKQESAKVFASTAAEYSEDSKKGFVYKYKEKDTVLETIEIRTWKKTLTEIVFYLQEDVKGSATSGRFIRIQKDQNAKMIEDLIADHCSNDANRRIKILGGESGPLSLTNFLKQTFANSHKETTWSYQYHFPRLAYFSRFDVKVAKKEFDKNGKLVEGSQENFTSTYEVKDFAEVLPHTPGQEQKYCEVIPVPESEMPAPEAPQPRYQVKKNGIGYELKCSITKPVGWP